MPGSDKGATRQRTRRRTIRQTTGEEEESEPLASLSSLFAGLTRTFLFTLRGLGVSPTVIAAALRKKAFLTIGQRTAATSMNVTQRDLLIDPRKISKNASGWGEKFAGLAKGTVLGLTVFGLYDCLVRIWPESDDDAEESRVVYEKYESHGGDVVLVKVSVAPVGEAIPLPAHFVCGAVAGIAQSIVVDSWELISYCWVHRNDISMHHHFHHGINWPFITRRIIHHAAGYATLLGFYEMFRRSIVHRVEGFVSSGSSSVPKTLNMLERYGIVKKDSDNIYDLTVVPLGSAFIAGGFAGQLHFVVDHYSRHWKFRALKKPRSKRPKRPFPKPPSMRSFSLSFFPTAACFLAFQYGADLTESWLDEGFDQPVIRAFAVRNPESR